MIVIVPVGVISGVSVCVFFDVLCHVGMMSIALVSDLLSIAR